MTYNLDAKGFKEKIFDYTVNKEWKYSGSKPAIIDFYAQWCGPCKMLSPLLEKISEEYEGRIDIYKVDTDQEPELSSLFGIQSVPSILFVPLSGEPRMALGALPRDGIEGAIKEVFSLQPAAIPVLTPSP
jgi:thioredoxin